MFSCFMVHGRTTTTAWQLLLGLGLVTHTCVGWHHSSQVSQNGCITVTRAARPSVSHKSLVVLRSGPLADHSIISTLKFWTSLWGSWRVKFCSDCGDLGLPLVSKPHLSASRINDDMAHLFNLGLQRLH